MVYAVVIAILNRGYYRGSSIQRTIRSSNSVFSLDLNVRLDLCSLGYVRWSWEQNFKTLKDLCNLFKLHVRKFPVQTNFPRLRNTKSFLLILDNYPRRICLRFLPPTPSDKIIGRTWRGLVVNRSYEYSMILIHLRYYRLHVIESAYAIIELFLGFHTRLHSENPCVGDIFSQNWRHIKSTYARLIFAAHAFMKQYSKERD